MPAVPLNYLAIVVAAAASTIIGMIWYGPLFGKQWKALMGFTDESVKTMTMTPTKAIIGGCIASLVMAYVLAHSLGFVVLAAEYLGLSDVSSGLQAGFWNWLGFVAPVTLGAVLWEGRPWRIWFLNAGYWLVSLLAMGLILALWP